MADAIIADIEGSGIYQIRNLVNGKRYVGSAVCFAKRWRQHRCELGKGRHNRHLQSSWEKHGPKAFVFEVLEAVPDKSMLIEREQHYIDLLKPAYNAAPVAGSNYGVRWSLKVKERMSAASKGVWQREGHRQKMSEAHKTQRPTEETLRKISAALKGRKKTPEQRAAIAKRNTERNQSPEHRELMSKFWKGRKRTPEQIEKMAQAKRGKPPHNKGKPASEEQKARQSATMKARYEANPELRQIVSERTREAMKREDVIAKVFASRRLRKKKDE